MSLTLLRLRSILVLWLFFMLVFAALHGKNVSEIRFKQLQLLTTWTNAQPAGELVKDFHLTQQIVFRNNSYHRDFLRVDEVKGHVCVRILFATYRSRRNKGTVSVRLLSPRQISEQRIDVATLDDNAWKRVCFADMTYDDIAHGNSLLEVRGLDSRPGKGVTAWVSDFSGGPRVSIMNQPSDKALIYEIELQVDDMDYVYNAWILMGFTAALLALIVHWVMGDPSPRRQRSQANAPMA